MRVMRPELLMRGSWSTQPAGARNAAMKGVGSPSVTTEMDADSPSIAIDWGREGTAVGQAASTFARSRAASGGRRLTARASCLLERLAEVVGVGSR
jgi:hypothetical protein